MAEKGHIARGLPSDVPGGIGEGLADRTKIPGDYVSCIGEY